MIRYFTTLKYTLLYINTPLLFLLWANRGDFEIGEKAYEQGNYQIAEVYLENIMREDILSEYIPDATYYLIKINENRGDFIGLLSYANRFLDNHVYDNRNKEVFNLLLEQLIEKEAFSVALDYMKNYDYLITDYVIVEKVGYGLLKYNRKILADYIFSLCPQTDTIKILRAAISTNFTEKRELYENVADVKGTIYLIDLLLETGDTIAAYEEYRALSEEDIRGDIMYPYAKISRLFDNRRFTLATGQLRKMSEYQNKALLLEAYNSGYCEETVTPTDQEEYELLVSCLRVDTVSRHPPEDVTIDTLTEEAIESVRRSIGRCYYIDSLYTTILLGDGKFDEALNIIEPYLNYQNTVHYARMIRALQYYDEGEYALAAKDIILSHARGPAILFILANCFTRMDKTADYLYERIIKTSMDTVLAARAERQLVRAKFENGAYNEVIKHDFDILRSDTTLMKFYCYSLARVGKREEAGSLFSQFFTHRDYDLENYYGEYLIDNKKYAKAKDYFDSIIQSVDEDLPDRLYYNWAFIPFLQGDTETALSRFTSYINNFEDGKDYYTAFFKIASINYVKQEFDTAAYYYGVASHDDSLHYDALYNQLICYKKSGNWDGVVETGRKILPLVLIDEEADVRFEIGYALLRSGNTREAIEYLKMAANVEPNPEFYYWLGEAYLGKGDFMRALYQYHKIIELFPQDEMWTPTSLYKTGIVFEFIDELDEARKIYKQIIKKRGSGDTWSIEAQKRLEEME